MESTLSLVCGELPNCILSSILFSTYDLSDVRLNHSHVPNTSLPYLLGGYSSTAPCEDPSPLFIFEHILIRYSGIL